MSFVKHVFLPGGGGGGVPKLWECLDAAGSFDQDNQTAKMSTSLVHDVSIPLPELLLS